MAGEKNLLNKLVAQARSLDEDALAAFSNKGLVRRARKDFSGGEAIVTLESADENTVKIRVADASVKLTEKGLTESVCDCPSTEVCRHILIACFWLTEQNEPSATTGEASVINESPTDSDESFHQPFQHLLEISLTDLEKAAGKRVFAQGIEFFQKNAECRITAPAAGVCLIEFVDANVSVRLLKDASISGHLCSCRKQEICQHKLAAILAFRRENEIEFLPAAPPEKPASALKLSDSQIKVLQKVRKLFEEFVEIGSTHLSESSVEQLQTLATSAGGASLFRLSFALKSLADGLNLSLQRSAQADESAWLIFLSKTYALASALLSADAPNGKFIGASRTAYEEIGTLELAGVGAYQWQTLSGYHGVTILFWDNRAKRFFSWTDARPKTDGSFTPQTAFTGEIRWQGFNSPKQAAESVFKLQNAARNSQNRLSGSGQINGFVLGATEIEKLDFGANNFSNWQELRRYFSAVFPYGLRERETFKEFAIVRPKRFGVRLFDEARQTFIWQILDENNDSLETRLAYNACNESAIETLEKLNPATDEINGVLVRLMLNAEGLYLQPISLFLKPKSENLSAALNKNNSDAIQIIHLNLTAKTDKKNAAKTGSENLSIAEAEIDENTAFEEVKVAGAIPQKLLQGREILQNLAESGTSSVSVHLFERLTQISESLNSTGLSKLAEPASAFTKLPKGELPENLLKLIFLFELSLEITQSKRLTV